MSIRAVLLTPPYKPPNTGIGVGLDQWIPSLEEWILQHYEDVGKELGEWTRYPYQPGMMWHFYEGKRRVGDMSYSWLLDNYKLLENRTQEELNYKTRGKYTFKMKRHNNLIWMMLDETDRIGGSESADLLDI